jgi:hypothetical protein
VGYCMGNPQVTNCQANILAFSVIYSCNFRVTKRQAPEINDFIGVEWSQLTFCQAM